MSNWETVMNMPEFGRKEAIMDIISHVYVLWQGIERTFKNVKDLKFGENYVSFADGDTRRYFSNVPFEVISQLPNNSADTSSS